MIFSIFLCSIFYIFNAAFISPFRAGFSLPNFGYLKVWYLSSLCKKRRERKAWFWKEMVVLWRFIHFSHGEPCCDSWPQSRERPSTILVASAEVIKTSD